MKNRELKQALKAAFDAPAPEKKAAFLQRLETPPISNAAFVWMQLRYLRIPGLLVSALGFAMLLLCGISPKEEVLWVVSAFSPFLALSVSGEVRRSYAHGMEELEFATRFSLKSFVLARMGCLSALNGLLLLAMVLVLGRSGVWILKAGVFLLFPYCTTISISLPLTRKYHGRGTSYFCVFASALVSACVICVHVNAIAYNVIALALALAAEIVVIASESAKLIHQTEELTWNYN